MSNGEKSVGIVGMCEKWRNNKRKTVKRNSRNMRNGECIMGIQAI